VVVVVAHDNTVVVQKDAVDGDAVNVAALAKVLDLSVVDHEAPLPPVDECDYWVDDDCWNWKGAAVVVVAVADDVEIMMMMGSQRRLRCSCHCYCCCSCCCCYCCCKTWATMMKMTRIATAKTPSCCWMEDDDDVLLLPLQ
jgi:hypothetical protein